MAISAGELRRIAPFATLPLPTLEAVAARGGLELFRPRQRLFRTGDACGPVFVLLDGFVRVVQPLPDGGEAPVGVAGPGVLLGLAGLRGRTTHDESAVSLTVVRAVGLPSLALLAEHDSRLLAPFASLLLAHGDAACVEATAALGESVRSRLLRVLRRLARPASATSDSGERIARLAVRLSHLDLSRLVGAERTTVTRELSVLVGQGVVVVHHGHVIGVTVLGSRAGQQ